MWDDGGYLRYHLLGCRYDFGWAGIEGSWVGKAKVLANEVFLFLDDS